LTNALKDKVTKYDHAGFIVRENMLNMYLNTAEECTCNLPFEYSLLHRCKEYKHSVLLVTEEVLEDHCFDLRSFLQKVKTYCISKVAKMGHVWPAGGPKL